MTEPKATAAMLAQARDLLGCSLFTEAERYAWLFDMEIADRLTARDVLQNLVVEYRRRERERGTPEPLDDAA